ncbi:hypothetical protein AB4Z33_16405 [Paenibacillus sp. 2TAB19]
MVGKISESLLAAASAAIFDHPAAVGLFAFNAGIYFFGNVTCRFRTTLHPIVVTMLSGNPPAK